MVEKCSKNSKISRNTGNYRYFRLNYPFRVFLRIKGGEQKYGSVEKYLIMAITVSGKHRLVQSLRIFVNIISVSPTQNDD
jgi:hypothetical protein